MTSLIIEVRVTSHEDFIYLFQGDDISRTLERIKSNQPYLKTLGKSLLTFLLNETPLINLEHCRENEKVSFNNNNTTSKCQ